MAWDRMVRLGVAVLMCTGVLAVAGGDSKTAKTAPVQAGATGNATWLKSAEALKALDSVPGRVEERDPAIRGLDRAARDALKETDKQGGDTCATAVVLGGPLPIFVSGTTVGYANDYDEVCDYTGSTAPDVVYAYTPPADVTVDLTLCAGATDYDSKLYLYENTCPTPGSPYACNDDACTSAVGQNYVSEIVALPLTGGSTYYIVVDGYQTASGTYFLDITESVVPACPEGSLLSQVPHAGSSLNLVGFPSDTGFTISGVPSPRKNAENYTVDGDIYGVRFWGVRNVEGWAQCGEDPMTFEMKFYEDDGGFPGAEVHSRTATIAAQHAGDGWFGTDTLWMWETTLSSPVPLRSGWVSIQGVSDPQTCWFLWITSPSGDQRNGLYANGAWANDPYGVDLSLCLVGAQGPGACCDPTTGACMDNVEPENCPFRLYSDQLCADINCGGDPGACCDDLTAQCVDGVLAANCPGRFAEGVLCADLSPACGEIVGACCRADATCDVITQAACTDGDWLGPNTACDQCPCIVPCPPGGTLEAEACGATTNDGCNMTPETFESVACSVTLCGTYAGDDTDFYEIVLSEDTQLTWTVAGEYVTRIGFVEQVIAGQPGCGNATGFLSPFDNLIECEPGTVSTCAPPGTYYAFVSADDFDAPPCGGANRYRAELACAPCVVPRGACCLEDGSCQADVYERDCQRAGGLSWLEGGVCDPNPCPQTQPGDNCSVPIAVDLSTLPYTDPGQTTCGRLDNYDDTCMGSYDGGEDVIYEVNVPTAGYYAVSLDPQGTTWTGIGISTTCPLGDSCVAVETAGTSSSPYSTDCSYLDVGTYYVMVDTYPAPDCIPSFDLAIDVCTPPPGRCCYPDGSGGVLCAVTTAYECSLLDGNWTEGLDCTTPCPSLYADTCEEAVVVPATPYIATVDNEEALPDGPPGSCDKYSPTGPMQNDVWWTWTATADCLAIATVTPLDSYDPVLTVRDNCTALTELACADEGDTGDVESITFSATAGTTYFLQVGDTGSFEGGGETVFELQCSLGEGACCFPDGTCQVLGGSDCLAAGGAYVGDGSTCDPNPCPQLPADACEQAVDIPAVPFSTTVDNADAVADGPAGSCDKYAPTGPMQNDAWFRWTATQDCFGVMTVTPDDYDAILVLRDNCTDLTELACSDGEGFDDVETITFNALAGVTYYFQIGDTGAFSGGGPTLVELTCGAPPTGACCVDMVCVDTNTLAECGGLGGQWYEGEDCATFVCPEPAYCDASGGCDEFIANVTIGDINNSTSCDEYADYTALSTEVEVGESYPITVTNGNPYGSDQCGLWVDWNRDYDFDDPGEAIAVTGTPGQGPYSATLAPPADAANGPTRMRVRITYTGAVNPCGTAVYGEVEDYTLVVKSICGDFNDDSTVDVLDYWVFLDTFGTCEGNPKYVPEADFDGDHCITLVDYQAWLACYRDYIGDPAAGPPQSVPGQKIDRRPVRPVDTRVYPRVVPNPAPAPGVQPAAPPAGGLGGAAAVDETTAPPGRDAER